MPVLQSAKRSLAAALLAAFAIGCNGDSTGPDSPFDPAGTSSDMAAVGASFDSPALASFTAAATEIEATTGGTAALAVRALPTVALAQGGKTGALRYAARLARAYVPDSRRPSPAVAAAIPAELLGTTFVFDLEQNHYVASDLTGAPSDGIRFLLYAINPANGQPIAPLIEVGYADVTTTGSETSGSTNIVVVSEGVTYLDYTAQTTIGSAINVGVSGYVTNGDDRVNFDLDNQFTNGTNGIDIALDWVLTVPTRGGFRIDMESSTTGVFSENSSTTLDLTARGPHGTVNISGTATNDAGTFQVEVNGDLFATIELSQGAEPVILGADGQALSSAELAALRDVFYLFGSGISFFQGVLDPLG